jgi:hypothetical protein
MNPIVIFYSNNEEVVIFISNPIMTIYAQEEIIQEPKDFINTYLLLIIHHRPK